MCPEGSCCPWKGPAGTGSWQAPWRGAHAGAFLAGSVIPWGTTLEQSAPKGLHPEERSHARAVLEGLSTRTEPRPEQGKSVRKKEQETQDGMS